MLKIKFKQYGIFKKNIIDSSLNSLNKYFFSNDIGRMHNILIKPKNAENKINTNINNIPNKLSDSKAKILNDRRTKNFLKEDEASFRQKQEFLKKETENECENNEDEEDSFLNYGSNKAVPARDYNVNDLTEQVNNHTSELASRELREVDNAQLKAKNSSIQNNAKENKHEVEKNFKSKKI